MNLQTHIKPDLWLATKSTYETQNYTGAVLDAMHHISNILREKTGADGDGQALVGQALGGDSPRLRINKLQTETERNEQKGIELILRGIYQAIRNPRSHEQIEDDQATADAIIYFIDYLLGIIQKSQEPFVIKDFLPRVFDPDFYKSKQYAELLISEIPTNKRLDTLVAIYRDKLNADVYSAGSVVHALISKLSEDELRQYMEVVSAEFSTINSFNEFRTNFHLLPPNLWEQLSTVSGLRAENKVLMALREGEFQAGKCSGGALATWASGHLRNFRLKEQLAREFIAKLESESLASKYYVLEYFFTELPSVVTTPYGIQRCVDTISKSIRQHDDIIRSYLLNKIGYLPLEWQHNFANALKDLTNEKYPQAYLSDGTPFLTSSDYPEIAFIDETLREPEFMEEISEFEPKEEQPAEPEFDEELPL